MATVLDELLSVDDASQVLATPEPVKSIRILFRSGESLGVWELAKGQSLGEWHVWTCDGKEEGGSGGYFTTLGGKILDAETEIL